MSLSHYQDRIKENLLLRCMEGGLRAHDESKALLQEILTPRPRGTVTEWAERHIYISHGATQGRYKSSLTPYAREVLECYRDRTCTDLILTWAAQTSKSLHLMIGGCYRIKNDPMPALWVMPNLDLVKTFSKSRMQPLIADSPAMVEEKLGGRHHYTITEMHFRKCMLKFEGRS